MQCFGCSWKRIVCTKISILSMSIRISMYFESDIAAPKAHMQARYAIFKVLLEAGEGLLELKGSGKCFCLLQCVAWDSSVLQCAAVCCRVLQCVAVWCSVSQCGAVWCSVVQCVAVCCSVLQCARLESRIGFP